MHSLKLIAGLGNPGRKHERDRHNVGFWFASRLALAQRIELKAVAKYHGLLGKLARPSGELWLLLPQTYMNLSGKSVGALARFYKIQPQEILVVHDELDFPPGTAKLKLGGGVAGHNGLKDIAQRPEGHRGAARHARVLASAHRHRPPGEQGPGRRVRAHAAARSRARVDRSGARSLHGSLRPLARGRHGSSDAQAAHEILMSLKCGIVGLPNVGKSTLFNALTKAGIAAENYPFCTIDPNIGIVEVPDPRLAQIAAIARPQKVVAAAVEFVDIAGLVAGASKGEGLGNQFLANIRECDAIAHVVRCFEDPNVVHVAGKVDPVSDIETIHTELALADLSTVEKTYARYAKVAKTGGDKEAQRIVAVLDKVRPALDKARPARSVPLSKEEQAVLNPLFLMTAKPEMFIANLAERGFENNPLLTQVQEYAKRHDSPVVPICAALEAQIADLSDEDKQVFLADMGMKEPGLNRLIRTGYALLGLQTFFTAGPKEVHAWTVPVGATAPQAAGVIHTDFERGFIRAEVIAYADYVACKGEQGAKEAGKMRLEGKEYVVRDGDVIYFRFNV